MITVDRLVNVLAAKSAAARRDWISALTAALPGDAEVEAGISRPAAVVELYGAHRGRRVPRAARGRQQEPTAAGLRRGLHNLLQRRLGVHENTVRYRLRRMAALTNSTSTIHASGSPRLIELAAEPR